jgi:hypothetical protein
MAKKLYIPKPGDVINSLPPLGVPEPIRTAMEIGRQRIFELGSSSTYNVPGKADFVSAPISKEERKMLRSLQKETKQVAIAPLTPLKPKFGELVQPSLAGNEKSYVPRPSDAGAYQDPKAAWKPTVPQPAQRAPAAPQTPNKVAASDPKWNNKVAWNSVDLLKRQEQLETYSVEVALMFEAVRTIIARVTGKVLPDVLLVFTANFGSPITNNAQKISIATKQPLELSVMLTRALVAGKLCWSADVAMTEATPLMVKGRVLDLKKAGGEIEIDAVLATGGERVAPKEEFKELPSVMKERQRRKVKL